MKSKFQRHKHRIFATILGLLGFVIVLEFTSTRLTYYEEHSYYCTDSGAWQSIEKSWFGLVENSNEGSAEYLNRLRDLKLIKTPYWEACGVTYKGIRRSFYGCGGPPLEIGRVRPFLIDFAKIATDQQIKEFHGKFKIDSPEALVYLKSYLEKH